MTVRDIQTDNGKILIQRRSKDNYIAIDEEVKIIHNEAVLTEIPNKFMKVKIDGMNELNSDLFNPETLKENQYRVDYELGRVYFNSSLDNVSKRFKYQGTGIVLYPASRIYTKNKDGFIQTLEQIMTASVDVMETINKLDEIIKHGDELYIQLNTSITTGTELKDLLNSKILLGNELIISLNEVIDNSNIAKIELQKVIDSGNKTKTEINDSVENATTINTELKSNTILATTKNNDLTTSIESATQVNNTLTGSVTSGTNKITEIDNKIVEVNGRLTEINAEEKVRKDNENARISNEENRQATFNKMETKVTNHTTLYKEYSTTQTYVVGNQVVYNGSTYQCIKESLNVEPTNETYWICIAKKGVDGLGSGDMMMNVYDKNGNGIVDNAEKVNGHTVECNVPSDAKFTDTLYNDTEIKNILNTLNNDAVKKKTLTNADFNNVKDIGFYSMQEATLHAPDYKKMYYSLIVMKSGVGNYIQQIAMAENTIDMYIRYLNDSTWDEWCKLSTNEDIKNKADLVDGKVKSEQLPDSIGNSYTPFYNTIVLEQNTNNISIGISQFNADTDDLEVVDFNGRYLNKTEWRINENKTSIDNISDEILWQKGDVFTFKVVKNIPSEIPSIDVSLIPNGSIVKEKLNINFINEVNGKVDKVEGKGLSSNDFTNEDKNKLNTLSSVASSGNYNDLTNKPTIPTKTSELNNDSRFVTNTELSNIDNKITLFNATCIYDTNYNLTVENNPTLPNYFTVRFKAPNNYIESKTFNIGSDTYTPKNASFETGDIVSVEFDKINKKCFFKVGGGSGVNETLPPQIENFNVISGNAKLDLTWTISDTTYLNGYVFTVKENSVPNNVNDGVKYEVDKSKTSCEISGLNNNTKYYVRPFPYNNKKQYQSEHIVENGTPLAKISISNLPIGSKIKFGKYQVESETPQPIIWKVIDNNSHYKDENNSSIVDHVTLMTEKIIDLRGFDAKEPNNSDSSRSKYGNNRYLYSNIKQWLNSNQSNWFTKQHTYDEAPTNSGTNNYNTSYDTKSGFLNLFTTEEISKIVPTNLKVALNTITDGGGSEIVNDKVFLLSETEVGLGNENGIVEGSKFSMFGDDASRCINLTEQCFNNTKSTNKPSSQSDNWHWWLRTPSFNESCYVKYVYYVGSLNRNSAYIGNLGIRPALNVNSEVYVTLMPDIDGCYVLI